MRQTIQLECIPAVEFAVRFASNLSIQNRFKVSNNHFPSFSSTAVIFVLVCEQMFLSCMHGF